MIRDDIVIDIEDLRMSVLPCGSIMSGQRRELDTIIPLSVLKLSTGNPAICQARTLTASPRIALSENTLEQGIFFAIHFLCQSFIQSCTMKNSDQRTLAKKWEKGSEDKWLVENFSVSAVGVCTKTVLYLLKRDHWSCQTKGEYWVVRKVNE